MTHPYRTSDRRTTAGRARTIARLEKSDETTQSLLPAATPASLLAGLIDEYRVVAQDRGVALRLAVSTSLPMLHVDRQRLARLVGHAVGDAIDATPHGGVVTVTAALRSGELVFTIRDDGVAEPSLFRIAVPAQTAH